MKPRENEIAEKFNLEVGKLELETIICSLRDSLIFYETEMRKELKKALPSSEELSYLGSNYHKTYNSLIKLEAISEENNLGI